MWLVTAQKCYSRARSVAALTVLLASEELHTVGLFLIRRSIHWPLHGTSGVDSFSGLDWIA